MLKVHKEMEETQADTTIVAAEQHREYAEERRQLHDIDRLEYKQMRMSMVKEVHAA